MTVLITLRSSSKVVATCTEESETSVKATTVGGLTATISNTMFVVQQQGEQTTFR